ncbi:MAG: PIN domain-containing protein [Acidobacteriota bacterium]
MSRPVAPMKVVFDCMIFLQATANEESPAATALDLLDTGEIKLYVSEPVLEEVRKVLNRAEVKSSCMTLALTAATMVAYAYEPGIRCK